MVIYIDKYKSNYKCSSFKKVSNTSDESSRESAALEKAIQRSKNRSW